MIASPEHAAFNESLNAYLDGELQADERARLEAHVDGCPLCREELEQLRLTRQSLRAMPALRAPRPFTLAVPEHGGVGAAGPAGADRAGGSAGWLGLLAWGWRLGSLGAAACLLVALLAGGPMPQRGAFSYAEAPAQSAAQSPREERSIPLANPNASQRVAPQGTPAPTAAVGAAGSSRPATSGGAAPEPMAAAGAPAQKDSASGAAAPPAAPPGATPAELPAVQSTPAASPAGSRAGAAVPAAAPAADQTSGLVHALPGAERARGAGGANPRPWLLAGAAVLGLASTALFAVERRARRARRGATPA